MRDADASPSTADRLRKARGKTGNGRVPTDLKPDDFFGYMIEHRYIFAPTGEIWPASSVDARLPVSALGASSRSVSSIFSAALTPDGS